MTSIVLFMLFMLFMPMKNIYEEESCLFDTFVLFVLFMLFCAFYAILYLSAISLQDFDKTSLETVSFSGANG